MMRNIRPLNTVIAAMLIGFSTCLTGCNWKGGLFRRPASSIMAPIKAWHIKPTSMRVYPSSRFSQDSHLIVLEARIELIDEMGDSLKNVGDFHFDLLQGSLDHRLGMRKRLYAWDVSTLTLVDQKRYYDPVTRAYFFRLKLDDSTIPKANMTLEVSFEPYPRGRRLTTTATIVPQ